MKIEATITRKQGSLKLTDVNCPVCHKDLTIAVQDGEAEVWQNEPICSHVEEIEVNDEDIIITFEE
jgi:hypothetical protein